MAQSEPQDQPTTPFLARAYSLSSVSEARALYDEWAATYDKDLTGPAHDWIGPALAAEALLKAFDQDSTSTGSKGSKGSTNTNTKLEILDAGCGTGIVGTSLTQQSGGKPLALKIDGIDLSTGMLDVARKTGAYASLQTADMSKALDHKTASYDAVICVGVLTKAHVGPEVVPEFVRVVKPGGWVVATVREDVWESGGYKAVIEGLEGDGKIKVVSADEVDSLRGAGIRMKLPVLKRLPE